MNPSRASSPALASVQLSDGPVTRVEFEAAKARLAVVETQTHSIDGGEQDLREQLRTFKSRTFRQFRIENEGKETEQIVYVHELEKDPSLEARMIRIETLLLTRIPPAWTQKAIVSFMTAVAVAILSKVLGVPLPELSP